MNRFLITSLFTLALLVGATGVATSVHAATCVPGYLENTDGVSGVNPDGKECTVGVSSGASSNSSGSTSCPAGQTQDFQTGNCVSVSANGTVTQGAPPVDAAAQKAAANTVSNPSGVGEGFGTIMTWIMSLFAWLAGVAMVTLNYATYYTVVSMGQFIQNVSAIGVTWRILRDIGNIMLIFGFLGIGISIILNVSWYGGKTKMLPMLMVAAIFLNFSLFFTEAIIDVGNLFATQFYTQINGGNMPNVATLGSQGISDKIMAQLGLAAIYNGGNIDPKMYTGDKTWLIGFMGILLFIILAFVLFSLAFILIARFIILTFLIILAPIGFAGLAVPKLAGVAKKWWDTLFEQTITAPVLMLLLYIALNVILDAQFLSGLGNGERADWLGTLNGNIAGFAPVFISFLIAMGLLIAVIISAKKLSAFGADKSSALAGKLTFGATAWGMRSTAGAGSQAASHWLRRTKFGATKTGRLVTSFADKGAKASFDVRGATAFGGLKAMGVVAGDAAKDGYRGKRDATIKAHEEYNKSVRKAFDDRGATKEEEKKIAEAEAAQEVAQKAHTIASEEHKPKEELRNEHKAEVERLAEEMRRDPFLGLNAEHTAKRDAAAQKLATSAADFAASLTKLNQATKDLEKAKDATKKETKESGDRISGEKKKASLAYAENITKSPMAWAVFGSGGNAAAKKIIKDAKHTESDDEKAIKAIKASIKKEADDAAKNAGGAGATPATPTPAPAPAADGH